MTRADLVPYLAWLIGLVTGAGLGFGLAVLWLMGVWG